MAGIERVVPSGRRWIPAFDIEEGTITIEGCVAFVYMDPDAGVNVVFEGGDRRHFDYNELVEVVPS